MTMLIALITTSSAHADPRSPFAAQCAAVRVDPNSLDARALGQTMQLDRVTAAQRLEWQGRAQLLDDAIHTHDAGFGGTWIDPGSGRIRLGLRSGSSGALRARALRTLAACGLGRNGELVAVHNDARTLEAATASVGDRVAAVNGRGGPMLASSLSYADNVVFLDVPRRGRLRAPQRALLSLVSQRWPGVVRVRHVDTTVGRPASCAPQDGLPPLAGCDPPLRGGITIIAPVGAFVEACSSGFTAVSRKDLRPYLMTAGHCPAGNWSAWSDTGNAVIGRTRHNVFGSNGDMGIMHVNNPAAWKPRPYVFVQSSADTNYQEAYPIHRTGLSSDIQGGRICKSGTWGSDCGIVTRLGATVTYEGGTTVRRLGVATFCARPGDSGGPVFATGTAYGLVSAASANTHSNGCP